MKSTSVMLYIANIAFGILAAAHVSSSSSSSSAASSSSLSSSSSMLRGSNTNHDKRRSLVHTTNAMAPVSDSSDPKHYHLHRQLRSKKRILQASLRTSMGKPKGDDLARPASKDGAVVAAADALLLGRFGVPGNVARFEVTNAKTSNNSKEAVPVVAKAAEERPATASCTSNEECKENEEYCAYNRVCVSLSVLDSNSSDSEELEDYDDTTSGRTINKDEARIASCTSNEECKENEEYCAYNRVCVSLSVLDSSSDSEELEDYDDTTSGRTINKDEARIASCTSNEECKENEEYCAYNRVCVSLSVLDSSSDSEELEDYDDTTSGRTTNKDEGIKTQQQQQQQKDHDDENDTTDEKDTVHDAEVITVEETDSTTTKNQEQEDGAAENDTTDEKKTVHDAKMNTVEETGNTTTKNQEQENGAAENNTNEDTTSSSDNDTTDEKDTVHDAEVITVEETDSTTTKNQEQEDGTAENNTTDEKKTVHDAKMNTVEETGNTTTKNQDQENGAAEINANEDTTSSSDNDTIDDKETVHDAKMSAVEETGSTTAKNQEQEDAETNANADTNSSSSKTMQILRSVGIAIGAIVAFALLFVLGLWCICFGRVFCRRRRKKQEDRDKSRPLSKVNGNQYNSDDDESDHESTIVDDNTLVSSSDDEERICNIRFLQVTANASTFESSQCLQRVFSDHSA